MKKLLLALALCLCASPVWAQCNGVFQPNSLCGNVGPLAAPPHQISGITSVFGPAATTSGDIPNWVGTTGVQLGDQKTITTSQTFNFSGQTSQFSSQITSAAIGTATISNTTITSVNITSNFFYHGLSYTFPTPITSAITSVTTAGGLNIVGITSPIISFGWNSAALSAAPLNPTGTTSTVGVMLGLGSKCTITPLFSTRVQFQFYGDVVESASGTATFNGHYGTGAAPTNGSLVTGSTATTSPQFSQGNAVGAIGPFSITGIMSGLTPSTAYWLDMALVTTAGTTSAVNVGCMAHEM